MKQKMRADSLDALRGFAIVMMVLCGSIIMGVLPAWMSHCQEPPPTNAFDPSIYGITWVDLVFPFFLFSMGAAFPFSIGGKLDAGVSRLDIVTSIIGRAAKLAFFAIFLQHVYPWASACDDPTAKSLVALAAFLLLFLMFTRFSFLKNRWARLAVHVAGYGLGSALMLYSNSFSGRQFSLYDSNIIILILAVMALFGMLLYMATYHAPRIRLAVMALLFGFFLSAETPGSWQQAVAEWTPLGWFYRMSYLKYLFIVVPGIYAGETLRQWLGQRADAKSADDGTAAPAFRRHAIAGILILSIAVIVVNLWGLFTRNLVANLLLSATIMGAASWLARRSGTYAPLMRRLCDSAAFMLLLGLMFEAYQGGIRKDDPTFSYYFATSGLAFYCLTALYILCDIYRRRRLTAPLTMAGKNPMIAYVATSLFVIPVLDILGIGDQHVDFWASNQWLAFARGALLTTLATLVAMYFTKIKWFWRT